MSIGASVLQGTNNNSYIKFICTYHTSVHISAYPVFLISHIVYLLEDHMP